MALTFDAHANFAYSTVATAPSPASSGTSLVVATGDGAKFPAVPFNAAIWPTGVQSLTSNAEIVRVTARSSDTLTITRAQESSSARSVVVGDQIANTITGKTLTDVENAINTVDAFTPYTTAGDLAYATSSSVAARLAIGSAFQVLSVNSGATAPAWLGSAGLISDTTLGSDTASIDITSITGSYAHLLVFLYARTDVVAATDEVILRVNNISTSTYDGQSIQVINTTVSGGSYSAATAGDGLVTCPGANATANMFGGGILIFPHYAGSANRKTWFGFGGGADTESATRTNWETALWMNKNRANTAISRLTFLPSAGTKLKSGTRITVYGFGV